jgi:SAM-dependent methyltransferase
LSGDEAVIEGGRIRRALTSIRSQGLIGYFESLVVAVADRWYDWRLAVDTSHFDTMASLGIDKEDSVDHVPIPYLALRRALRIVPWTPNSSFLDYGAGRGRAVLLAATRRFRRVVGVEHSPVLAAAARANLKQAKRLLCPDVAIVEGDARDYEVPDDVDVIYFFKPFRGDTLNRVLSRVRESHLRAPRRLWVIFFNDQEFRQQAASDTWLRRVDGRTMLAHTRWPIALGIYVADPDGTPTSRPCGGP